MLFEYLYSDKILVTIIKVFNKFLKIFAGKSCKWSTKHEIHECFVTPICCDTVLQTIQVSLVHGIMDNSTIR